MDVKWLGKQFPDLSGFKPLAPSGQKEVFAATHKSEGQVVLKIFKPGANAERILREVQAPLKVKSPRVPKVSETGRTASPTGEIVWLREQRIAGKSLRELLAVRKQLDPAEVVGIGLHVIEVLDAAEKAKVVHRDIKPGNLIIAPDGSAWVIDFGLARHLDQESVTPTGDKFAPCTPGYAPIEQFTNQKRDIDSRADLFATGVTLYECIEGNNPFRLGIKHEREAIERVRKTKLPRVTRSGVPDGLVGLIEAMTRSKPEHRLTTAAEALTWIREFASDGKRGA